MKVWVRQRHRAVVEDETTFEIPDDKIEEFSALTNDGDRETWLNDNAEQTGYSSEIDEILETVSVVVTW